jgi:hypothetical protein
MLGQPGKIKIKKNIKDIARNITHPLSWFVNHLDAISIPGIAFGFFEPI